MSISFFLFVSLRITCKYSKKLILTIPLVIPVTLYYGYCSFGRLLSIFRPTSNEGHSMGGRLNLKSIGTWSSINTQTTNIRTDENETKKRKNTYQVLIISAELLPAMSRATWKVRCVSRDWLYVAPVVWTLTSCYQLSTSLPSPLFSINLIAVSKIIFDLKCCFSFKTFCGFVFISL